VTLVLLLELLDALTLPIPVHERPLLVPVLLLLESEPLVGVQLGAVALVGTEKRLVVVLVEDVDTVQVGFFVLKRKSGLLQFLQEICLQCPDFVFIEVARKDFFIDFQI